MGMTNETPKDELEDILDIETPLPKPGEPTKMDDSPEPDDEATTPVSSSAPIFKGSGMRWGLVGGLILVVAIVILAAQNTQSVEFSFLTWEVTAPLSALILGSAVVAVILDELAGWIWGIRRRRQLRHNAELKQLKAGTEPEKTRRFGRS